MESRGEESAVPTMQQMKDGHGQSQFHIAPGCDYDRRRVEDVRMGRAAQYTDGCIGECLVHEALRPVRRMLSSWNV